MTETLAGRLLQWLLGLIGIVFVVKTVVIIILQLVNYILAECTRLALNILIMCIDLVNTRQLVGITIKEQIEVSLRIVIKLIMANIVVKVQIIIKLTMADIVGYCEYCMGKVVILVVWEVVFIVIRKQVSLTFCLILPFYKIQILNSNIYI